MILVFLRETCYGQSMLTAEENGNKTLKGMGKVNDKEP